MVLLNNYGLSINRIKMRNLLVILLITISACNASTVNRESNKPERTRTVKAEGYSFSASIPEKPIADSSGTDEWQFRSLFLLEKAWLDDHPALSKNLQYELDSAFYVIAGKDTVWPRYVLPIANGQPLKPEFIIAVEKQRLLKASIIELHTRIQDLEDPRTPGVRFEMQKINSQ
jgi:hypothetical protein